MRIEQDDVSRAEVRDLLRIHHENSALHSPPESTHVLDISELQAPSVTFWTLWDDTNLVGCGALKELATDHGEIKSMHTLGHYRGRGAGAMILTHIIETARLRHYTCLSLETGAMDAYAPARALYRKFGFKDCAPFANYQLDPYSQFMNLQLSPLQR